MLVHSACCLDCKAVAADGGSLPTGAMPIEPRMRQDACQARLPPSLASHRPPACSFINVMTCDFLCLCALAPFW